jgi:hypothetical protein
MAATQAAGPAREDLQVREAAQAIQHANGFRHFIRQPRRDEIFSVNGRPFDPTDMVRRLTAESLMRKVALRLQREPAPPTGPIDNPNIPAGYTYLFQLVGHDLVHSTAHLSLAEGRLSVVGNTRASPLRLDTVYGSGPAARPDLYVAAGEPSGFNGKLRIGPLRTNGTLDAGTAPTLAAEFDLARGVCPYSHDGRQRGLPEAIVGDPRNDDHPILSQLVVLFHALHNAILSALSSAPAHPAADSAIDRDHVNFIAARTATTLIYRNILRHDLLVRLLQPAVRSAYEHGTVPIADQAVVPGARWSVPFELTHAVMRAAHTMIRPSYQFNAEIQPEEGTLSEMLRQSSSDQPGQMPLQTKWALDWTRFFGAGPNVNFSQLIRPSYGAHLFAPLDFPAENGDGVVGLAYRDLLSGMDGQPWSLAALVKALRPTHGALLATSPLFAIEPQHPDARAWQAPLATWLRQVPAFQPDDDLTDDEITSLAADPPLSLFFAFEAAQGPTASAGRRLGVLGSILVGDVLYNAMRNDPTVPNEMTLQPGAQMTAVSMALFDTLTLFAFLPEIKSFDALLAFMTPRMPQVFT